MKIESFFHLFTIIGALFAGFDFLNVIMATEISAPQQAAGAAMACAWVIIPYCHPEGSRRAVEQLTGR